MRTLLIVLALATPAAAQNYYYRGGYQRPIVIQQNVQRVYVQRRLYQPLLYSYGYGPNIYGNYTSADQPVFIQTTVADPFGYGGYAW